MALLWIEGFESLGTTIGNAPAPANVLAGKYPSVTSESSMDIETGRNGVGRSIQMAAGGCQFRTPNLNTTDRTLITGFAFKLGSVSYAANAYLCSMWKDATWDMSLYIDGYGTMSVRSNAFQDIALIPFQFVYDKWYWIEWKVYTDNSAGTCEVRVGGKTVLALTGIDTQFTASNYKNAVSWKDNNTTLDYFDDCYVCDGTGAVNNDFLGNGRVKTLRPDGDSAVSWTPTGVGANFDEVDEAEHDAGTTNVAEANTNNQDLYTYDDLTDLVAVKGLMINSVVALDSAGSETYVISAKSGATEVNTANLTVASTSYLTNTYVLEQDPDVSAAWTPTTVNAALFGYKYI